MDLQQQLSSKSRAVVLEIAPKHTRQTSVPVAVLDTDRTVFDTVGYCRNRLLRGRRSCCETEWSQEPNVRLEKIR